MITLTEHGFTEDCEQCTHIRAFNEGKPGLPHSEKCRKRITESLAQSPEGAARLDKHEERVDRALAERLRLTDDRERLPHPTDASIAPQSDGVRGGMALPSEEAMPAEAPTRPEARLAQNLQQMREEARARSEEFEKGREAEDGETRPRDGSCDMEESDNDAPSE